jgi:FMN phosphatase YigB (HAD superfamily)
MKIFIDFDDVLFNAKKFKRDLICIFKKHGVDKSKFEDSYYTYPKKNSNIGRFYYPGDQVKRLKKIYGLDTKNIEREIGRLMNNLEKYIFRDVDLFLENYRKSDLFLITFGHKNFQKDKIKGAKIGKYFRNIIISRGDKLGEILKIARKYNFKNNENILMIDDRPEYLERIEKGAKMIKTFHMRRPQGRYSHLGCKHADCEVENFKEIEKIIKKEEYESS